MCNIHLAEECNDLNTAVEDMRDIDDVLDMDARTTERYDDSARVVHVAD